MLRSLLLLLAAAAAARAACPSAAALRVEAELRPVRGAGSGANVSTELRLALRLRNGGEAPVQLRNVRLQWQAGNASALAGGATSAAPDLAFSCWFARGGGSDNACRSIIAAWVQAGPPAQAGLRFTGGKLHPGESLSGGAGGVIGAWHAADWAPTPPDTLTRPAARCDNGPGDQVEYAIDAPTRRQAAQLPSPPPPLGGVRFARQLGGCQR
jgi:hypothetical protein